MSHIIICEVRPDAQEKLKALRLRHLQYIDTHRADILFGGPARAANGLPETMIIVHVTGDRGTAEHFISEEPYNASGEVFASVLVRSWSQVLPDLEVGALKRAVQPEMESQSF